MPSTRYSSVKEPQETKRGKTGASTGSMEAFHNPVGSMYKCGWVEWEMPAGQQAWLGCICSTRGMGDVATRQGPLQVAALTCGLHLGRPAMHSTQTLCSMRVLHVLLRVDSPYRGAMHLGMQVSLHLLGTLKCDRPGHVPAE